jgi:hypothetical protein
MSHTASTVTELSSKVPADQARRLAHALTRFSAHVWRIYTHPASAAEDHGANSEGWRRERHREAFTNATDAVTNPNLPTDDSLVQSYNPSKKPPTIRPRPARGKRSWAGRGGTSRTR